MNRNHLLSMWTMVLLAACGGRPAEIIEGDYGGELVASFVTDDYALTLVAKDADTVTVKSADFPPVDIDVMGNESGVTSVAEDAIELSWTEGSLAITTMDFVFSGGPGAKDGGAANGGGGGAGDDDDDDDDVTDTTTDDTDVQAGDGIAADAEGSYTGLTAGIVNDTDYTITVTQTSATRDTGSTVFQLGAQGQLAELYAVQGDFGRCRSLHEQRLRVWTAEDNEVEVAIAATFVGIACLRLGEVADASRWLSGVIDALEDLALPHYVVVNRLAACAAHRLDGRPEEARACLDRAFATQRLEDNLELLPWALAERGLAAEEAEAQRLLADVRTLLRDHPQPETSNAVWAMGALAETVARS